MGTNTENLTDTNEKTPLSGVRRLNQPTAFVVRWRALQHELKVTRLGCFLTEISQIVAMPCRPFKTDDTAPRFRKSLLSNSIAT